ncbi:Methyl viologen resistance protein SmvA [Streptomyces sp. ADI98-10]|nr:Methyl viologen resistance protein SmvA [Streptomyces sp. ADI98-10]
MSTRQPGPVSVDPNDASGESGKGVPDARRRRTTPITVCLALMAVIASVSGPDVTQPDLVVAFGASQSTTLWIINIYPLGLAALPLGAIGDRLGREPVLLTGLTVFEGHDDGGFLAMVSRGQRVRRPPQGPLGARCEGRTDCLR